MTANTTAVDVSRKLHEPTEYELGKFCVEASDLRLPLTGRWPMQLTTDLGNGQPFLIKSVSAESAVYMQGNGCIQLTVFND
jgi:hypothetical protein